MKDGFRLLNKPASGDLLGTTFASSAAQFYSPLHIWMAEDRGADRSGFTNNAAIGRLSLDVSPGGELRFSGPVDQFEQPLPGQYALYVDYLQMQTSVSTDPESVVWIDPGLTIYFANANVAPEQLDGKFNGHLRWVKNYAGAASGTPVASRQGGYEVKSITVNTALLNSQNLDSDADGLANAYDNWPFDGVTLKDVQVVSETPLTVRFAWDAAGQTVYRVESTPTLQPAKWTTLTTLTNAGTEIVTLNITNSTSSGQEFERFYRVRYDP